MNKAATSIYKVLAMFLKEVCTKDFVTVLKKLKIVRELVKFKL